MPTKRKPYLELLTEHEGEEEVREAIVLPLCAKNSIFFIQPGHSL